MDFLYELFESLGMTPNVIEDMLNLIKSLPALPFVFLMWVIIYVIFIVGSAFGLDSEQIEAISAGIRGFFASIIEMFS